MAPRGDRAAARFRRPRRPLAVALGARLTAAGSASAPAQTRYHYRDENGVRVVTDRQPDSRRSFETRALPTDRGAAGVQLLSRDVEDGTLLVARNTYHAPV